MRDFMDAFLNCLMVMLLVVLLGGCLILPILIGSIFNWWWIVLIYPVLIPVAFGISNVIDKRFRWRG